MRKVLWLGALLFASSAAFAVPLSQSGPADAGRVQQRVANPEAPIALEPEAPLPRIGGIDEAPAASKKVKLTLREVRIDGMTVFAPAQVEDIYQPYIGRVITLDTAWLIAGQLTERYRHEGYFLSRAFVPLQTIEGGIIRITVVEGYIGEITLDDEVANQPVIADWLSRLRNARPLKVDTLESVLLQLNDLPGVSLRAVLEPLKGAKDGAVQLTLLPQPVHDKAQLVFDNFGSRFLGPYELSAQYSTSLLPLQQTSISYINSVPFDELHYGNVQHRAAIYPGLTIEAYAGYTNANPGFTLSASEIKSNSLLFGVAFDYTLIRQRQENLLGRVALESRSTHSNILDTPLTRDEIRTLRAKLSYQRADAWGGVNLLDVTLSQGIDAFGASAQGSADLSRPDAVPDFTKAEFQLSRTQAVVSGVQAVLSAAGQVSSDPLYSAEEFGYGGQAFGRAYDNSEITGDHGLAGSFELQYTGLDAWEGVNAVPYGFYDIGTVWNDGRTQEASTSGSSAGAGVRFASELGISANFGFAFPLTRAVTSPLEGNNGKNPRATIQLSYGL
ncbi:MAG: BamA/TamA family outer membrane protein [Rickettsiales bacterium]|nr:BamA/TamA family outer membrane protein [Rickettsiales bacterium]